MADSPAPVPAPKPAKQDPPAEVVMNTIPEGAGMLSEDPVTGLPVGFGSTSGDPAAKSMADLAPEVSAADVAGQADTAIPEGCPPEITALAPYLPPGLTLRDVWNWKRQYGAIYFVDVCDIYYFYRAMSKPEYKNIMNLENATRDIQEEKIVETCVLFPQMGIQVLRVGLAGLASSLTEYIMRASAFGTLATPTKL